MPTYEYECQRCGHIFDVFQKMSDPPRKRCPKCRGKVKRLLGTGAGIIFKGPGFYATDYRSQKYHESAKADKGGADSDTSKKDKKASSPKPESSKKKESQD